MSQYPAILLLVAFLSGATMVQAESWSYLGLAGPEVNCIRLLYPDIIVGAEDGLHVMTTSGNSTWLDLDHEGVAGWPVSAVGWSPDYPDLDHEGVAGWPVSAVGWSPDYPDQVITGRVDEQGRGALATTQLFDGATVLSLEHQPGLFTRIDHTGRYGSHELWACTPGGENPGVVLKSSDGGAFWYDVTDHGFIAPSSFATSYTDTPLDTVAYTLLCGDQDVRTTMDDGLTWNPFGEGLPATEVLDVQIMAVPGPPPHKQAKVYNRFYAATDSGLYFMTEEDLIWSRCFDAPCTKVRIVSGGITGGYVYVLTQDRRLFRVYLWAPYYGNWYEVAADLVPLEITDFAVSFAGILVSTRMHGVFVTGDMGVVDVPIGPGLLQLEATPNPFNPTSMLSFDAPRSGRAHLAVYDLRGRCVDVLLDEEITAGPVNRSWQPRDLPSGVYLARLQLNGATSICRVALIR